MMSASATIATANRASVSEQSEEQKLWVDVIDKGVGIRDVAKAMEPLFTTKPEKDRSGMGFTFMEAFMDEVTVESQVGYGTVVHMKKTIGR